MPKPDPALLDPDRYPFHCAIETRYSDVDTNRHINNVALVDILQEGRVRFHAAGRGQRELARITAMAVSISVEFLGEARAFEPLDMHVAAVALGRTSHTLAQLATQGGRTIAFARTVLVFMGNGKPVENSAEFRESIAQRMIRP